MSSFRRYGGLNYSANNNITKSYISNAEQMNINNHSGQINSKETFASHIDMSGNSILHTGTIYFQNGTSINSSVGAQGATGPTGPPGATGPKGDGSWEVVGNNIYYNNGSVIVGNTANTGNIYADNYYLNNKPLNSLYPNVPAVTFGTVYTGSTSIFVIIDYAAANQIYFPNSGIPIPAISGCSFDISYTYNGSTQTDNLVTYSQSSPFNINYVLPIATNYPAPPLPSSSTENYLTGIVISQNLQTNTTPSPITFPNNITYNAVVFNTSAYPDVSDFTIKGTYYNYTDNSTPTVKQVTFTTSYPPSSDAYFDTPPTYSTSTTNSSSPISTLTLTYNPPMSLVTQGSYAGVSLTSFTTDFQTDGNTTTQYGGPQGQTQISITNPYTAIYSNSQSVTYGSGVTNTSISLYPECSYTFYNLTSTNNNPSTSDVTPDPPSPFGPYTTQTLNILDTLLITNSFIPKNISSFNNNLISTTPISSAFFVSNSTQVSNLFNNQSIISNTFGPYSINYDTTTRGTLGADKNLMNISLSVTNTATSQNNLTSTTINSTGFTSSTNPTITSSDITINSTPATDQYSTAGFTGYYLKLPSFSGTINIPSSLTTTNNPYTFSITQTYFDVNGNSVGTYIASENFYYDNVSSSPSISTNGNGTLIINNNNNNYYSTLVSGIYVLSSSPTFTLTGLSLTNMGDYFYINPFVTYNFSQGCTGTVKETNLIHTNVGTSITLPNPLIITNNSIASSISSSYNTSINLSITLANVYITSVVTSTHTLNVIVDDPSANFVTNITTLKNLSSTTALGYRVWSAPADYGEIMTPQGLVPFVFIQSGNSVPNTTATGSTQATTPQGYINFQYNNIWDISLNTLANEELLIANGNFTTNPTYYLNYSTYSGNGNLNTVNYSTLTGTKFATFAWNVPNTTTTTFTNLNFTIDFTAQLYQNPKNNNFLYFDSGYSQQLLLYYRFEYTTNVTSSSWGPIGSSSLYYPNTAWISFNSSTINQGSPPSSVICSYANATNVYWTTPSNVINSNNNYTIQTALPVISFSSGATLYLRVGLPNDLTTTGVNNVSAFLS
jgi:hypothetical protein